MYLVCCLALVAAMLYSVSNIVTTELLSLSSMKNRHRQCVGVLDVDGWKKQLNKTSNSVGEAPAKRRLFRSRQSHLKVIHTKNSI